MPEPDFRDRYGPWALVAGASMGIGAALSDEIAGRGLNVVMLARGAELLEAEAQAVRERHGVEVRTLSVPPPEYSVTTSPAESTI